MSEILYPGSLHSHTDTSNIRLRDAIIKVEDAFKYAETLRYKVLGFTDHESISSWIKIETLAKKYPTIKAIRGNEIYLCRNGLNNENFNKDNDKYWHFILLAKDLIGAYQIMELSSRAWHRSYMARGQRRVPTYYQDLFDIIGENPGHVIASTACLGGVLPTQILKAKEQPELWGKIKIWIEQIHSLFGEDFYFEMQPSKNKEQIYVNKQLLHLSEEYGIPYIITTDSHYLKKDDREVHSIFLRAQNGEREVGEFYATTYMMDTKELESFFPYFTQEQLQLAYSSINKIADRCEDYSLTKSLEIPTLTWRPVDGHLTALELDEWCAKIPHLEKFMLSEHKSDNYLARKIIDGIKTHLDLQNEQAYQEINSTLEMTWTSSEINKVRWSKYYLNLQRIIDLCWEAGSLVGPGRGSGVGFILLYVLDITQINPLREKTKSFAWRLTLRV